MDTHQNRATLQRVLYELLLIVLAVGATIAVSFYLQPITHNTSLSPEGIGMSGWPLPFIASYWADYGLNSYQAQNVSLLSFALDVALFYVLILLVVFLVRPITRRYDPKGYVRRYVPFCVLCLVAMMFIYCVIRLYSSQKAINQSLHTGVATPASPVEQPQQ